MQKASKNVSNIVKNALCSACGACAGICPVSAITMEENAGGFITAKVDDSKCIQCLKCVKICPGNGKEKVRDFIGESIQGYLGYAEDSKLRLESQSGGVVTALLRYLMEQDIIDAAVLTRFNCNTRRAESFLATSLDEVESAKGSHYTQSSVVETILQNQDKRLAAVVLGCQSLSIKQIRENYKNVKLPVLTIGLVCAGNLSGHMVDDILAQAKIKSNDKIKQFRFRDKSHGGWPGDISIYSDKQIILPKTKRMELKHYYQNYRCVICANKMNQDCDLVIGDPWGISIEDEEKGYSAIITRTKQGEKALTEANEKGYIALVAEDVEKIVAGQKISEELKPRHQMSRIISAEEGWMYPYKNDENEVLERENIDQNLMKRMEYLRKLQLTADKVEVLRLIRKEKKRNYHPIREFLYRIKKKLRG